MDEEEYKKVKSRCVDLMEELDDLKHHYNLALEEVQRLRELNMKLEKKRNYWEMKYKNER